MITSKENCNYSVWEHYPYITLSGDSILILYLLENKLLSKSKLPWKIIAYVACNHFELENKRLLKSLEKWFGDMPF